MGWTEHSKADKIKAVGSIVVLAGLASLFIWGQLHEKDKRHTLKENGIRTIGLVYDRYKPYKGSRVLKYHFFVNNKKYKRTATSSKRFPTNIGDMRVVVYDPADPTVNKMLIHEPINDSSDLEKFKNEPMIFNP